MTGTLAWFPRYGLPIQARNQLHKDRKTSENLWYEESIPSDTLMYTLVVAPQRGCAVSALSQLFPPEQPYLQVGGNETVGHGWFVVTLRHQKALVEEGAGR